MSQYRMRSGFVLTSIGAHLGFVWLASQIAVPEQPTRSAVAVEASGLTDVEVTLSSDDLRQQPAPQAGAKAAPAPSVEPAQTKVAARPVAPHESSPPSISTAAHNPRSPGREQRNQPSADSVKVAAGGDWLSLDQQLDADEPVPKAATAQQPRRDELVERLLARERERQQQHTRDELAAQPPEPVGSRSPNPTVAPLEREANANHERADAWVELTRWLPRAASSDPQWETLATNTRLDVQVVLKFERNELTQVSALGVVAPIVQRLLRATEHLMQRGTFKGSGNTTRHFELRIRLSQTPSRELWIAHTTPDPPKPGVGSFVAPSGRRFDVWVSAER